MTDDPLFKELATANDVMGYIDDVELRDVLGTMNVPIATAWLARPHAQAHLVVVESLRCGFVNIIAYLQRHDLLQPARFDTPAALIASMTHTDINNTLLSHYDWLVALGAPQNSRRFVDLVIGNDNAVLFANIASQNGNDVDRCDAFFTASILTAAAAKALCVFSICVAHAPHDVAASMILNSNITNSPAMTEIIVKRFTKNRPPFANDAERNAWIQQFVRDAKETRPDLDWTTATSSVLILDS